MTPDQVVRFHDGENAIFSELVATHSPQLLAVAARLTGDRAHAHDLVHDAWVHAFQARRTFRGSGSFVGWMLAVLRTCFLQEQRSAARTAAKTDAVAREPSDHDESSDFPISALDAPLPARLLDALAQLGERQRDVIVLRVIEERSVADTARALGVAEGTVQATLSQALQRLRVILTGVTS